MFKDLLKQLAKSALSKRRPHGSSYKPHYSSDRKPFGNVYKKFSSSDRYSGHPHQHHNQYGHSYYKKKKKSSFFSS
ncbi:hypothetical protein [Paenibacillus turpanensis]|uniref:hypothetical protein n=1 Tax=Paenibacillus turpanensis TaxID=2689078 RepID=UPI0014075B7C|nr:hypothetical protein [Paenibacillus turpanensis]